MAIDLEAINQRCKNGRIEPSDIDDLIEEIGRLGVPPQIASLAHLWALYDPHGPNTPAVTEGYMAEMLGVDRLTLRTLYTDWLAAQNAENATEVLIREAMERLRQRGYRV